jgi:methylenetetrahydrofolate reductase (NADPH)
MNFLRKLSTSGSFPLCYNLLPHFAAAEQDYNNLINYAKDALQDGRIQTFFLSDRPTCKQEFSSLRLAEDILAADGEPIISLALTFHDRKTVMDRLQKYIRAGVQQFVFVSGDYPLRIEAKNAKPVYDIDSVQLLMLLADLLELTDIAKGCVINPFKHFESEQIWQYEKLRRKISLGADFIVSQIGYDLRKFDELIQFCTLNKITAPLVANVYTADMQTAGMIQARAIPGVKMPGSLLRMLNEKKPEWKPAVRRTVKTLSVLKGLGYQGALLGSATISFSETKKILDEKEGLEEEWQNFVAELDYSDGSAPQFYYFQKDPQNSLNSSEPAPVALKHFPSLTYLFSYFIDWLVYVPQGPLFKMTGRFCHFCSTSRFWYGFLWLLEYVSKRPLYGCNMCGDCTLYACGFLCYQSGCPKKLQNGPCGGSIEGYCEVFPGKKRCYWVKVYHNMKGVRQHVTFTAQPIPARDTSLHRTSSWINFFTGKDHRKMKFEETSGKPT